MLIVLATATVACADDSPGEGEWISLFNGKDLNGWKVKITGYELNDNHGDTFRVENGVLRVAYDQYEQFDRAFGHLIYEEPFSHYLLRVEYRFVGDQVPGGPGWAFRNSGIMVHGSFVFGMDGDDPSVFDRTVDWALEQGLEAATFHILTPYPGTPLYARLAEQGRITSSNWSDFDTRHVVFRPARMFAKSCSMMSM